MHARAKKPSIYALLIAVLCLSSASVQATDLGFFGLVSYSTLSTDSPSAQLSSAIGTGFGTYFLEPLWEGQPFGFEAGFTLHQQPLHSATNGPVARGASKAWRLSVPALIRLKHRGISLGAGYQWAVTIGDLTTQTSGSPGAQGLNVHESALVASLRFEIPLNRRWALLSDFRYHLGLSDQETSSSIDATYRHFVGWFGIRWTVGPLSTSSGPLEGALGTTPNF